MSEKIINKGTGAGGCKTNLNGKNFEFRTNNEPNLLSEGFSKITINESKYGYYLYKKVNENTEIFYTLQNGFKIYMKKFYNIDAVRHPDEAYIIKTKDRTIIKILEKKEQNVEGSVDIKLWAANALKREYEITLNTLTDHNFIIEYVLCVNKFLENKFLDTENIKYKTLTQIYVENNIAVLFGNREKYFERLHKWINNY